MKIAVIGYSGAGKSTLTKNLARKLDSPYLYLDTVNFCPNWVERDRDEARKIVWDFMTQNPAWIIDGNYTGFYQAERLEQADHIVFLNFPRLRCLRRAWKRNLQYMGKVRESAANGCTEKLDWEFVRWILWDGRTKARREHYRDICRTYREKVTVCKSDRDTARFLASIPQ